MKALIVLLIFAIRPVHAEFISVTNKFKYAYEDKTLSENEKEIISTDIDRIGTFGFEMPDFCDEEWIPITNNTYVASCRLKREKSLCWPNDAWSSITTALKDNKNTVYISVPTQLSNIYRQKKSLLSQYPTIFPLLDEFATLLANQERIHEMTETEKKKYALPKQFKNGNTGKDLLKYDFDKDIIVYPPSILSVRLMPPIEHGNDEIDFEGYHFSRMPDSATGLPNFIASICVMDRGVSYTAGPVLVVFKDNAWKVLNY